MFLIIEDPSCSLEMVTSYNVCGIFRLLILCLPGQDLIGRVQRGRKCYGEETNGNAATSMQR